MVVRNIEIMFTDCADSVKQCVKLCPFILIMCVIDISVNRWCTVVLLCF